MKIKSLMIPDPITVTRKTSIEDAIQLMKANGIRHLPVVGKSKVLQGFVTLADLKQGLIPAMVSDLNLTDLMIPDPITVGPDDDIESAARLIYEHKIGGMPVVLNRKVVGIITESDLLRAFIDMMGILTSGSRIDVRIGCQPEEFNRVAGIIQSNGGEIVHIGMSASPACEKVYSFRVKAMKTEGIEQALQESGFQVVHDT
jgi:acetoin utilization protein AcuB